MTKNIKYLAIAAAIAQLSKDPSTKVGAVILGADGEGGPWGYNGAPRGCKADEDNRFTERPEKYYWAEHAERNAIYAAARKGFSTVGGAIIITHPPCMECARAIVQSGLKKVILPLNNNLDPRWNESWIRSIQLFDECGVEMEFA